MNVFPQRIPENIGEFTKEDFITSEVRYHIWKRRFDNMVKAAKEAMTSQWAAPILLAILLGYSVYSSHQTDQKIDIMNRAIIVLQTQKEDAEKQSDKDKQTAEIISASRYDQEKAWRETMINKMNRIEMAQTGKLPKTQQPTN